MAQNTNTKSTSRSKTTSRSTTRTAAQRKTAGTKSAASRKQNAAKRNTRTAKRTASRTTARTQTAAAREAAAARRDAETTFTKVGDAAERTALTYVGATLEARDRVVELLGLYTDPDKLQRQLKKFERRGTTTRNRVERELKKQRTRVERQLRQRTRSIERDAKPYVEQINVVGAQVENVASGVALAGSKAAKAATERVSALV